MNAFKLLLVVFGMLMSGMMNAVEAAPITQFGGIIRFEGMIVEDGCDFSNQGQKLQSSCYRNGEALTSQYSMVETSASPRSLPGNLGTTQVRWLDNTRRLGIVTVNYK